MCGRYMLVEHQEISERFQLRTIPFSLFARYNAAPSQELPVVVEGEDGARDLRLMRWGLVPRWQRSGQSKPFAPINARAETLLEKPMFRGLVGSKRCIIPANGFYEWQRSGNRKQPYRIHLKDDALFGLAGLYDETPAGEPSFAIITTAPNEIVAPLHDRMPVILRPEDEADWLDRDETDPHAAQALLRPYPTEAMTAEAVSPAVNNTRNDGPDLLEPEEQTA